MLTSKHCNADSTEIEENDLSYGDVVIAVGSLFIAAPYQAATLEVPGKEKLIVNLAGFDCTTFVETVLALAGCTINGKITASRFRQNLKFIRYRQGIIAGYASRLHYFTDWLHDGEKKKILQDVSRQLGGKPLRKKIDFMTTQRELYPAMKSEREFQKMLLMEKNLSRKVFHVIGKNKFDKIKNKIQNGDVIAFATNREGMDVSHVGFALWQKKNLRLLHASSKEGAVVISKKTIAAYLQSKKDCTGIIVGSLIS